jgi:hypothetical protein
MAFITLSSLKKPLAWATSPAAQTLAALVTTACFACFIATLSFVASSSVRSTW